MTLSVVCFILAEAVALGRSVEEQGHSGSYFITSDTRSGSALCECICSSSAYPHEEGKQTYEEYIPLVRVGFIIEVGVSVRELVTFGEDFFKEAGPIREKSHERLEEFGNFLANTREFWHVHEDLRELVANIFHSS